MIYLKYIFLLIIYLKTLISENKKKEKQYQNELKVANDQEGPDKHESKLQINKQITSSFGIRTND